MAIIKRKPVVEITKFIILSLPIIAAILLAPLAKVHIQWDSIIYLNNAMSICNGEGLDYSLRGPIFFLLLAGSFKLFGVSIISAVVVVRLFFVATLLATYGLAWKLFDKWTGWMACWLLLGSYAYQFIASNVLLDIVFPFFVILGMLLYLLALQHDKTYLYCMTGLVLGLAYITKELSIFFLPFPAAIWLFNTKYRNLKYLKEVSIVYICMAIPIFAWVAYGITYTDNTFLRVLFGHLAVMNSPVYNDYVNRSFLDICFKLLVGGWEYLVNYYRLFYQRTHYYTPAVLFVFFGLIWRARFHFAERCLLLGIILFLPAMIALGKLEYRLGQNIVIYLLLAIVMAHFILLFSRYASALATKVVSTKIPAALFAIVLIAFLLVPSIIHSKKTFASVLVAKSLLPRYIMGLDVGWQATGWLGEPKKILGEFIADNTESDAIILATYRNPSSLTFFVGTRRKVYPIWARVDYQFEKSRISYEYGIGIKCQNPEFKNDCRIGYIWLYKREPKFWGKGNFNDGTATIKIYILNKEIFKKRFLERMSKTKHWYVLIGGEHSFLTPFFVSSNSFELVKKSKKPLLWLFKMKDFEFQMPNKPIIGDEVCQIYRKAVKRNAKYAQNMRGILFLYQLGFTQDVVSEIATPNLTSPKTFYTIPIDTPSKMLKEVASQIDRDG